MEIFLQPDPYTACSLIPCYEISDRDACSDALSDAVLEVLLVASSVVANRTDSRSHDPSLPEIVAYLLHKIMPLYLRSLFFRLCLYTAYFLTSCRR